MKLIDLIEASQPKLVWVSPTATNESGEIMESFFSANHDVLMPVIRGMLKTALRPLVFKLWKRSPNAMMAVAAMKRLKDQGDDNPIRTLMQTTDLDVPGVFLKRLAHEFGITGIHGVGKRKPELLPSVNENNELIQIYHITLDEHLDSIKAHGLIPQIGVNSKLFGETDNAVHIFFDVDSAEDAFTNWDMELGDDDDPLWLITMEVPSEWVTSPWDDRKSGAGIVINAIPPSMFTNIREI